MSAPDKCPRCGADSVMQSSGSYFRCGTWATSDGTVDQSRDCTSAQRDALSARVNELESFKQVCENPAALWANWLRGTVALPAGIGDIRQEQARVRELEAYASRLEEAGDKLRKAIERFDTSGMDMSCLRESDPVEIEGLTVGDLMKAALSAVRWDQAKETKP